jgi:hypothetical protein
MCTAGTLAESGADAEWDRAGKLERRDIHLMTRETRPYQTRTLRRRGSLRLLRQSQTELGASLTDVSLTTDG